ncbi:MAG: hypothetical protein E7425_02470 [Ruminococcaceae bacterium]|nr:hypothetical protein [Oscillospiraceae bacterium]
MELDLPERRSRSGCKALVRVEMKYNRETCNVVEQALRLAWVDVYEKPICSRLETTFRFNKIKNYTVIANRLRNRKLLLEAKRLLSLTF